MIVTKSKVLFNLSILAFAVLLSGCDKPVTENYLAQCDALASHPEDPNRYAAGVPDQSLAPGAIIETCTKAIGTHPNLGRIYFQLGRAYLVTNRQADSFAAFVEAADRGHSGAQKYIGDAFLNGFGLPKGVETNAGEAMNFYKESAAGGFAPANDAIAELESWLARNRFNPEIFQNPYYITILYTGDFKKLQGTGEAIGLLAYVRGMAEMLNSEQMMDHDAQCNPLLSKMGFLNINLASLAVTIGAIQKPEDFLGTFLLLMMSDFAYDQGRRDVVTLSTKHGCEGQVAQTIVRNVMEMAIPVANQQLASGNEPTTQSQSVSRAAHLRNIYVQTCTLKVVNENGDLLPEAAKAYEDGTFSGHFARVKDIVEAMKGDPQSDLNRLLFEGRNHVQLLVSSPYFQNTSVKVAGLEVSSGDIRSLKCPDQHIKRTYHAEAWLNGTGLTPEGLAVIKGL